MLSIPGLARGLAEVHSRVSLHAHVRVCVFFIAYCVCDMCIAHKCVGIFICSCTPAQFSLHVCARIPDTSHGASV